MIPTTVPSGLRQDETDNNFNFLVYTLTGSVLLLSKVIFVILLYVNKRDIAKHKKIAF
jgi:hypothetical protein